jgi:Zn-dependent alcohol dehydrogenase
VVIVGAGPIRLATILGAKRYSPAMIVAIDPVEARRTWAIAFGSAAILSDVRCLQVVGHPDVGFDVCADA